MEHIPKVSVIMPFYNCEKYLRESIQSIIDQTFSDFELILINDASKDGSDKIAREFVEKDSRIKYILNDKNLRITHNLNLGLRLAKAPIIARMDGDDVSYPDRFEKQYAYLQNNPQIDVVGSYIHIIDEKGYIYDKRTKPISPEQVRSSIIYLGPVAHPATMFRKETVERLGGYKHMYGITSPFPQDMCLWYRIVFSGGQIANLPEYLLKYRRHKNNVDQQSKARAIADLKLRRKVIKEFKLKLSFYAFLMIYLQFIFGYYFSAEVREQIEGIYKKLFFKKS